MSRVCVCARVSKRERDFVCMCLIFVYKPRGSLCVYVQSVSRKCVCVRIHLCLMCLEFVRLCVRKRERETLCMYV